MRTIGTKTIDKEVTIGAYTLPDTDGSNGQALVTNGVGIVTWGDVAAGGNLDGGNASSIYLISQHIDGGSA
jgi:hypothetical protein